MEEMYELITDALAMVDVFVAAGVRRFNIARLDISRRKMSYGAGRNQGAMRLLVPNWIPICWELHHNLIIQPERPAGAVLAQLDDLSGQQLDRVAPMALVGVETSPQNFQAWLVIPGGDNDLVKRLIRGAGSDPRASCSGRIAGSPNCKSKYAPAFPAVRLLFAEPGRRCDIAELDRMGMLPPPPADPLRVPPSRRTASAERGWPDYAAVLAGAPMKADGTPDRSAADFLWSKWALQRGHGKESVVAMLLSVSAKAQERGERSGRMYAENTVDKAEKTV